MTASSTITIASITAEGFLVFTALFLVSYGYPSSTRESLWEEGGIQGFNSNPKLRIYFYANYEEPPPIPYIWSQTSSDFNLAVAILTFWCFITRCLLRCFDVLNKPTELFLQSCVLTFWVASIIGQRSADYTDEKHPSQVPWYLTRNCNISQVSTGTSCRIAQASFVFSVLIACFYGACIWKTLTHEVFKWLEKRIQAQKQENMVAGSQIKAARDEQQVLGMEECWSDDESPLMRAWDDL